MPYVYINGEFFTEEEAKISVFDHGFLYGDGIFETLRSYSGRIFCIEDHLHRLFESARKIYLEVPWGQQELVEILRASLKINQCQDAVLRLSISRGAGPPGLDPDLCPAPTLTVMTRSFQGYPEKMYHEGVSVTLVKIRKNLPEALDPGIKSTNFLNNILAKIEAKKTGADEGILLNHDGFLTEGTVSNLFFVTPQSLCTPSTASGILEGVSRKVVLEIAQEKGIPVEEGLFSPADLASATEIFLTNTTYEVMPVGKIDQKTIQIGPTTQQIRQTFREKNATMNVSELVRYIDHTCLKIQTTSHEIEEICREAGEWNVASICIPPCWVQEASTLLRGSAVHVGTVIGFPLGYTVSPAKVLEAETAQRDGADEIDIVMQVGRFKAGGHQAVEEELKAIIRATPELTHKIIIECCVLSDSEKEAATRLVLNSGAEYIKTSTGFGSGGATVDDVRLLNKACDGRLKVKAAGGINNLETVLRLIRAGAKRIGTSSAKNILSECKEK